MTGGEWPRSRPGIGGALPAREEGRFLFVAALVWMGALAGRQSWGLGVALLVGVAMVGFKREGVVLVMAAGLVAGALAGWASAGRERAVLSAPVVEGHLTLRAVARSDPRGFSDGRSLMARPLSYRPAGDHRWADWRGPVVMVETPDAGGVAAGEVFEASGHLSREPGKWGNMAYAARMRSGELVRLSSAQGWLVRVGNRVRARVKGNLRSGPRHGRALLAGFLIGDTSDLSPTHVADLRRSGLSHYVAVSGGNVVLFLGALWILLWPIANRPGPRAVVGFLALAVFMVITRWEPSVLRAGLLAGLVLGAQAIGFPLSSWAALGVTVILALLVSADLAISVGFALSVAATLGVMVGIRAPVDRRPRWVWQTLCTALGAQVAVAPLLLWFFGSVPLLSPLANLVAGPLVAISTSLAGIGALTGVQPLVWAAAWAAEGVLAVSGLLSPYPQLGWWGICAAAAAGWVVWRFPILRPVLLAAGVALLAAAPLLSALTPLPGTGGARAPAVVFLDVGQGDSVLVLGTELTVLIDGGPDPARLADKLRRYGVRRVDLMVMTHPHEDHVRGLEAVVGAIPVGAVWDASHPHRTPSYRRIMERIAEETIAVHRPPAGHRLRAAELEIEVLGPRRRYKHVNDQSIVLRVDLDGVSFLMAADIEEAAQAELPDVRADVLKVPHQGAATSDRRWLEDNAGRLAVISVGPNDYGHPARWVEEALRQGGAQVLRTDLHGDVVVKPASS